MGLPNIMSASLSTRDVDEAEQTLRPVVGEVGLEPASANTFQVRSKLWRLQKMGLLQIDLNRTRVIQRGPREFWCATICLSGGGEIVEAGRSLTCDQSLGHAMNTEIDLDLRNRSVARYLVVTIDSDFADSHLRARGMASSAISSADSALRTDRGAGARFACEAQHLVTGLQAGDPALRSRLFLSEREDLLTTLFVEAWLEGPAGVEGPTGVEGSLSRESGAAWLERAEEHLASRLSDSMSLAELADIAGVSVRTLSRGFLNRHGLGPMSFLKRRRMEAVQQALLGAERGETSITEIAMRYGFHHAGRFSVDYRREFGETPSTTLARAPRRKIGTPTHA